MFVFLSTISQIYMYIYTSIHVITNSYKHGKCIACSTRIVWVLQLVTLHLPLLFCSGRLRMAVFGISGWRKWSTKRSGKNKSLQIWLILVSEILNLIYVALKLFARLHEVNKKSSLKSGCSRKRPYFQGRNCCYFQVWGDYRNYPNISRWNFQASPGFEEIGSGTRRWNTRPLYMEFL